MLRAKTCTQTNRQNAGSAGNRLRAECPAMLLARYTVYLLDPSKGYYIARKGSNGFICFVMRTAWEWAEFRATTSWPAMSYDARERRNNFSNLPGRIGGYEEVPGKLTALQVRDIVVDKDKKRIY